MIDKEGLTRHIVNLDDKIMAIRTLDKAESVLKNYIPRYTDFFDPYQISLCTHALHRIAGLKYIVTGGREGAERQIIMLYPEFMEDMEIENPLRVLKLEGKLGGDSFTHRDVLGAILGLGIKREKIGDIIAGNGRAYVVSFKEICDFIQWNLEKISRYKVTANFVDFCDIEEHEESYKLIESTVPSLRLDAVIGVGFGESRSSLSKLINNDRVKVNWKPINNPAHPVQEGDVISFKGKGRMILLQVGNKTKKDRYQVIIKRMI
ncbi:YlmH family RNA-binding protein [Thermotalea metallivorans]|uniref:RNA-binding S4 domain-containing protein n=1 Tax=Thermotalea metallivorans TaxID=520762 RepID=A0A140L5Z1_9FIRM|nr:YlmH/Sll1252 family protein [Thermotalea metallivorans]KXG75966.1 hypothetical protein AN619_14300 [Thermotalea metallivorans]